MWQQQTDDEPAVKQRGAGQLELSFWEAAADSTVLPFRLLLDGLFQALKSIISFDLAHTLPLIPRYDCGIHDWKILKKTCPRTSRRRQNRVNTSLSVSTDATAAAMIVGGSTTGGWRQKPQSLSVLGLIRAELESLRWPQNYTFQLDVIWVSESYSMHNIVSYCFVQKLYSFKLHSKKFFLNPQWRCLWKS